MKITQVCIVSPPHYPHSRCFNEVAQAFAQALDCPEPVYGMPPFENVDGGRNLVFATHLLHENKLHSTDIVYQAEQMKVALPTYHDILSTHEVWDYASENVAALTSIGVNAKHVPIAYMPVMTKPWIVNSELEQDIDVLFYGSTNQRRLKIIHDLEDAGLTVRKLFGEYGHERDVMIARSKVILNVHFFERGIFEIFRCSHLFANKKCVVSEDSADSVRQSCGDSGATFCKYNQMVDYCRDLVKDKLRRVNQELDSYHNFAVFGRTLKSILLGPNGVLEDHERWLKECKQ